MTHAMPLEELAEVVERLADDDHEALFEKMKRRRREAFENRVLAAAEEIQREYAGGKYKVSTPQELVDEIFS
jgi:hypothetical protein